LAHECGLGGYTQSTPMKLIVKIPKVLPGKRVFLAWPRARKLWMYSLNYSLAARIEWVCTYEKGFSGLCCLQFCFSFIFMRNTRILSYILCWCSNIWNSCSRQTGKFGLDTVGKFNLYRIQRRSLIFGTEKQIKIEMIEENLDFKP